MAKDLNTITISGNLVDDVDLRYTPSDLAVADFRIASNRPFKDGDEWDEKATFITVTVWRELAERVDEAFGKGDRVVVVGLLDLEQWENDDGDRRSMHKIVANTVQPMGRWGDFLGDDEEPAPRRKKRRKGKGRKRGSQRPSRSRRSTGEMDDDDIPF